MKYDKIVQISYEWPVSCFQRINTTTAGAAGTLAHKHKPLSCSAVASAVCSTVQCNSLVTLLCNTQRFHFQEHTRAGKGVCRLQNSESRTLYVEWVRRQTRVPHYSSGPSSSALTIEPGASLQPYLEIPFPGTRKAEVRLKQLNSAPLGWATSPACKDLGNISLLLVWP